MTPDPLDDWPNCTTPDCDKKACLWGIDRTLCHPCNARRFGMDAMDSQYEATHPEPEDAR